MITISCTIKNYAIKVSGSSGHIASTISQKAGYDTKIDKETLEHFMHYGTAFINAMHDVLNYHLIQSENIFFATGQVLVPDPDEYIRYRNVLLRDYLVAFQTMKNIATLPAEEARKLLHEKITVIDETYILDENKLRQEYETKYPDAKISIKRVKNDKGEDMLEVRRTYENKNLDYHINRIKEMYQQILQLSVTYKNKQLAMEKLYQKMEQFENIDLVSMFATIMEIRERLDRIENALLAQAIEKEQAKENQELEQLKGRIIERTEQITEAVYGEPETVQDIEYAEAVTKNARSFLDMVKDTAVAIKNQVMATYNRVKQGIRKMLGRDKDKNRDNQRGLER